MYLGIVPEIAVRLPQFSDLCRRFGVRSLELFGSGTGAGFDASRSDIGLIVEFADANFGPWMKRCFDLKRELEALFGRSVDLLLSTAVRGSYFGASVNQARMPLYAAA